MVLGVDDINSDSSDAISVQAQSPLLHEGEKDNAGWMTNDPKLIENI